MSEDVGDGATEVGEASVGGRRFWSRDAGEELPEGSLMGVKGLICGLRILKLLRRRFSNMFLCGPARHTQLRTSSSSVWQAIHYQVL